MATIQMAVSALNKDSAAWTAASTGLKDPATAASARDIPAGAFPINVPVHLSSAYTNLRSKVADLLTEGAQESADVAAELTNVRNILQASDEAVKQELDGMWDYE